MLNIIKLTILSTAMVSGGFSKFPSVVSPFCMASIVTSCVSTGLCNAEVGRKKEDKNRRDKMQDFMWEFAMSFSLGARMTFTNPITFANAAQKLLGMHLMNRGYILCRFSKTDDKSSSINGFNNVVGGAILFASRSSPALSCAVLSMAYADCLIAKSKSASLNCPRTSKFSNEIE